MFKPGVFGQKLSDLNIRVYGPVYFTVYFKIKSVIVGYRSIALFCRKHFGAHLPMLLHVFFQRAVSRKNQLPVVQCQGGVISHVLNDGLLQLKPINGIV